jgi:hypothetical protein
MSGRQNPASGPNPRQTSHLGARQSPPTVKGMPKLTLDQEQQVYDALIQLGWLETEHALHSEGVRAVRFYPRDIIE